MKRESVDQLIARVMAAHQGTTPKALAVYYEDVHQELAPLARDLEASWFYPTKTINHKGQLMSSNSAVAAIAFALNASTECSMEFLRCWFQGDFDAVRREWPEAPDAVFVGADPLHQQSGVVSPALEWPKQRDVGRAEDMGSGHLRLVLDADNDVCVEVFDGEKVFASVEFC
ncbi:MAG: hypothetical protein CVU24_15675, partial [Betaproteobacteria bacterium HGW-Betaproteobacteria-18]